jgi:protein arginine kinase activator
MNCDVCQQGQATVFLTQIVDGKMQKVNLCENCSREKGVTDPTGFALADLLMGMGAAQEIEQGGGQKCPACGFSQSDFKKTGRLGCPACYQTFAEGLAPMLSGMHKGTVHTGKRPVRMARFLERRARLKDAESELRRAVAQEDYETAARLRDEIRELESAMSAGREAGREAGGGLGASEPRDLEGGGY